MNFLRKVLMGKRIHYMDALNVLSCFAVVVLHSTLHVFGPLRDSYWKTALVLQGIFIFAVPVFFMLSGSHLLNYRSKYSTATFFRKRLIKVGGGLLIASAICYVIYSVFPGSFYAADSFAKDFSLRGFLSRFATDTINDRYWFLYSIIYLYLITPLLAFGAEKKRLLEGILVTGFLVAFAIPMLTYLHVLDSTVAQSLFNWPFFASTSTFYYIAGYYLSRWPIEGKSKVVFSIFIGLLSLLIMGWLGFTINVNTKNYDSFMISVDSAFCAIYSISIFVAFQALERKLNSLPGKLLQLLSSMASTTFFIYLFHVPFINWLGNNLRSERLNSLFYTYPIAKALFVFVVVGALSLLWNKLKARASAWLKNHDTQVVSS